MDDPLPIVEVALGQHCGELVGPERLELSVVQRDTRERGRDRLEEIRLHVGEALLRRHCRRDPTGNEVHFLFVVVVDTGNSNRVQRSALFPPRQADACYAAITRC